MNLSLHYFYWRYKKPNIRMTNVMTCAVQFQIVNKTFIYFQFNREPDKEDNLLQKNWCYIKISLIALKIGKRARNVQS